MSTTPKYGLPLPLDTSLIRDFPKVVREQSTQLEALLPGAMDQAAKVYVPGEVARQTAPALADAAAAKTSAATSAKTVQDLTGPWEDRLEGLEALGGLTPEGVTDGQTSNLIAQEGTLTRDALNAANVEAVTPGGAVREVLDATYAVAADDPKSPRVGTPQTVTSRHIFVDRDGRLYRTGGGVLSRTLDGTTWEDVFTFPAAVSGMRQMDNGEFLVSIAAAGATNPRLYVSTNDGTAYTQKLTASNATSSPQMKWSGIGGNGIYVVSEYDSALPGSRGTNQRVWLTQDYGSTWTEIYDHGVGNPGRRHVHGAAYDKYRDAIWLTLGDHRSPGDGNRAIRVSWDRGATWETVTVGLQPTTVLPMGDAVIFGSDNAPNAIQRIENPSRTNLVVRVHHKINDRNRLTHVAEAGVQAERPGAPILLPWSVSLDGEHSMVLASYDGIAWWELWRDTRVGTAGTGANLAVGPGPSGEFYVSGNDANGAFEVVIPGGTPGLVSTASRQTSLVAMDKGHRSYVAFSNVPGQAIPHDTFTEVQIVQTPYGKDDPTKYGGHLNAEDLFVRAEGAEGVIVTRDAIVTVTVDPGVNAFTFGPMPRVAIARNGNRILNGGPYTQQATLPFNKGDRISGFVYQNSGVVRPNNGATYSLVLEAWEQA